MYLVTYDITSNKIRNKIAKCLSGYGNRVQYSVFECEIHPKKFKQLYRELLKRMEKSEEGNIRIYYIDEFSRSNMLVIGDKSERMEKDVLFI